MFSLPGTFYARYPHVGLCQANTKFGQKWVVYRMCYRGISRILQINDTQLSLIKLTFNTETYSRIFKQTRKLLRFNNFFVELWTSLFANQATRQTENRLYTQGKEIHELCDVRYVLMMMTSVPFNADKFSLNPSLIWLAVFGGSFAGQTVTYDLRAGCLILCRV